jgi:hypothetical protein
MMEIASRKMEGLRVADAQDQVACTRRHGSRAWLRLLLAPRPAASRLHILRRGERMGERDAVDEVVVLERALWIVPDRLISRIL